jgi:putative hemolysin
MPKKTIIFILAVLVLVGVAGYFAFRQSPAEKQNNNEAVDNQPKNQPTREEIFGLDQKETGTKLYYSEKLGVGFTYLNYNYASKTPVTILEKDNKISVDTQTIEVFEKDPSLTLAAAIEEKFLKGYNSADCWVKSKETSEQNLESYISATISYPPAENSEEPFFENSKKCPQLYSETNGMQYFLMNKDVPDRFLFVRIGQYSAASDGTPRTETGGSNWTGSIRILPLENSNNNAGLANPASVNCAAKGGNLVMQKRPDGGEYGLCFFEDNCVCEEWAMFRGECAVGGVKTTGFDTDAQKFCVWSGGQTLAVENAVCTFSDGSTCLADDFYTGKCQKGEK